MGAYCAFLANREVMFHSKSLFGNILIPSAAELWLISSVVAIAFKR